MLSTDEIKSLLINDKNIFLPFLTLTFECSCIAKCVFIISNVRPLMDAANQSQLIASVCNTYAVQN